MSENTAPKTVDELEAHFRDASASAVCLVSADVDGHIGYRVAVDVPVRRRGNGILPLEGWEPGTGFEPETVPFDAMPATRDPEIGFVATANNAPTALANSTPGPGGPSWTKPPNPSGFARRFAPTVRGGHGRFFHKGLRLEGRSWSGLRPFSRAPCDVGSWWDQREIHGALQDS